MCYTGSLLGDECAVGWQHVKDGWISMRAKKTEIIVEIPMFAELKKSL
jgi:hypothetical protein